MILPIHPSTQGDLLCRLWWVSTCLIECSTSCHRVTDLFNCRQVDSEKGNSGDRYLDCGHTHHRYALGDCCHKASVQVSLPGTRRDNYLSAAYAIIADALVCRRCRCLGTRDPFCW